MLIISIITAFFIGTSAGIGFFPIFRQPKNIIVQLILAVIGLIGVFILLKYFL